MKINKIFEKIQNNMFVQAMRRGLISLIPILMIGSFALLLATLPIKGYITFISTWCGGVIYNVLTGIQKMTMGLTSLYMAGVVGYHMGVLSKDALQEKKYGTMLVSVGSFFVLSGAGGGNYEALDAKGMFVAILAAGIGGGIYILIAKRVKNKLILADGADMSLGGATQAILPALISFAAVVLLNDFILGFTDSTSVYVLLVQLMGNIFKGSGSALISVLGYVVLTSILWFFGIHGSDVLESTVTPVFNDALAVNTELVQSGQIPTEIFTKPFLDSFVLMGGCGASICLLIALLLFSRRKGIRNLMKLSAAPMLFNINEILVFGLPIIYNSVFLIPFILAPVACCLIAYAATRLGLVPVAYNDIQWTTPILFNSYFSTESFRGILLQLVNIVVGVAIYAPFVRLYDKRKEESAKADYELMVQKLKASEAARTPIQLTDSSLSFGWMGKALAADLEHAFAHDELKLFYQPQYNDADHCIGVEALLRWKHPHYGWIYPPLIIKLAEETGIREKLEQWVVRSAMKDAHTLREKYSDAKLKVSINITGASIQQKRFEDFLEEIAAKNNVKELNICLEITEQDALMLDETLRERFRHLNEMGYMLAVDDFSMGSTSIAYLTGSHFELVKLDGSLVKGMRDNPRCREIIASIVRLSDSLELQVIAEYVSDEKIRESLLEVGCRLYQGWYYSPAIPLEEFEELMQKELNC